MLFLILIVSRDSPSCPQVSLLLKLAAVLPYGAACYENSHFIIQILTSLCLIGLLAAYLPNNPKQTSGATGVGIWSGT